MKKTYVGLQLTMQTICEPRRATENSHPQPLQPDSTAGAKYFRETDYDDLISLDYRKKKVQFGPL